MARLIDRIQFFPPNPLEIYYYPIYEVEGKTIKGEFTKFVSGKDYTEFLAELQAELDSDSPTPITPKPDWAVFNRLAATSPVIGQILTTTANQAAALRLQLIGAPAGYSPTGLAKADYPLFQGAWEQVIEALPEPLTPEMIAELNAIAASANMDFVFNEEGKIEI
jgi:hypothetical protein